MAQLYAWRRRPARGDFPRRQEITAERSACTSLTFVCLSRAKRIVELIIDRMPPGAQSSFLIAEEVGLGGVASRRRYIYTQYRRTPARGGCSRRQEISAGKEACSSQTFVGISQADRVVNPIDLVLRERLAERVSFGRCSG